MKLRHFKKSEFTCKCGCGENEMNPDFLQTIDMAREFAEVPFKITSGYRCKAHNKKEGGSINSSHLSGKAADISCPNSEFRFKMILGLLDAGVNRIGMGEDFIHADTDYDKAQLVAWLY